MHRMNNHIIFFLTKDQVKACIDLLIAFNEDNQKVCTLGTVPDRVFIVTSCYDVLDDLSVVAQWIMLTFAPFILFNSSGLHYFFLKYTDNFSNTHTKNQLIFILSVWICMDTAVVFKWWPFWVGIGRDGFVSCVVVENSISIS